MNLQNLIMDTQNEEDSVKDTCCCPTIYSTLCIKMTSDKGHLSIKHNFSGTNLFVSW